MQSKTSFFNKTFFFKSVKRLIPYLIFYVFVWSLILTIPLISYNPNIIGGSFYSPAEYIVDITNIVSPLISTIAAVIAGMVVFSFFNKKNSFLTLSSLPIGRDGLFISTYTSAVVSAIFSNAVVYGIVSLLALAKNCPVHGAIESWFAVTTVTFMIFFGFAAFSASLTGTTLMIPVIFYLINSIPSTIYSGFEMIRSFVVFGAPTIYSSGLSSVPFMLTPLYSVASAVLSGLIEPESTASIKQIHLIWLAVSIVLSIIALLIFKNKRTETATEISSNRFATPFIRLAAALFCSISFGTWFYEVSQIFGNYSQYADVKDIIILIVCLLIGLAVGWFVCEMFIQKKVKVFTKRICIGYAASAAVITALVIFLAIDPFSIYSTLPNKDDVDSVNVRVNGAYAVLYEKENISNVIDVNQSIMDNKEIHKESNGYVAEFEYTLKSGKVISRYYMLSDDDKTDLAKAISIFYAQEATEYSFIRYGASLDPSQISEASYSVPLSDEYAYYEDYFTPKQAANIYTNGIVKDVKEGNLKVKLEYLLNEVAEGYDSNTVYVYMTILTDNGKQYVSWDITPECVNTMNILNGYGIPPTNIP